MQKQTRMISFILRLWVELCTLLPPPPKKDMLTSLLPVSWNVTFFGNRVLARELVKMEAYWSRVGPYSNMTGILIKREKTMSIHRHPRRMPCEKKRQRLEWVIYKPRNAWGYQKLEEAGKDCP